LINGTRITEISPTALSNVTGLRRVNIRGNYIEEIEAGTFANPELASLYVVFPPITSDTPAPEGIPAL
jgi:Leucine-rich repeat (LRR) protein